MGGKSKENDFREWLINKLLDKGFYPRNDALNSSAFVLNCSQISTKRYLDKMISSQGPMKIIGPGFGMFDYLITVKGFPYKSLFEAEVDGMTLEECTNHAIHLLKKQQS